ncbi:unnamed protein product [Owenia fusiformis]|uniref:Uncharacterized protein n=1 Tax=Owenia fusiformis TaxID=6347 RepID=A0A8S4PL15_OWEFU|nr:unnamed protein product [Owenia fusiformis]
MEELVNSWTQSYNQEVACYAKPDVVTEDQMFSEVYHTLIHSPAMEALLDLEHTYALAIVKLQSEREADMKHLESRQQAEMEDAIAKVGTIYTDQQVNQLAQKHYDNTQLIESKWASELSNLQETQKRQYKNHVMKLHEAHINPGNGVQSYVQRVRAMSTSAVSTERDQIWQPIKMEESFTIHLGAQKKTTHNLRLLCAEVLDLCRNIPNIIGGVAVPQPQRLQTAMSLYSNNLCGLILLVDNKLNSYTGLKKEFAKLCQQSTEFHFPDLEKQFQAIEENIIAGNEWRQNKIEEPDQVSIKSGGSNSSGEKDDKLNRLIAGDFYITRHSNLSEVHLVFHLVVDDSLRDNNVNSRHPVILGIRNILKACVRYDVFTVTIPLLLVHEMSEEMTIQWCMKRAELVLKCTKGFMMELSTWGGHQSRNIQFMLPKGLSDNMFLQISAMMPTIFRVSNAIVVKSS